MQQDTASENISKQGHIAAHRQKSQCTMNMSWEQLKASSILGCCIASPVSAMDIVPWNYGT